MLCPLIKSDCVKEKCAWWDCGNKCCAVLGIVLERIIATETMASVAPRGLGQSGVKLDVHPVVQVKEIIKTITVPTEGKNDAVITSSPSTNTPAITW